MKRQNVIELAHSLLQEVITPQMTIVDATCGHGYDTLFLAKHVFHVHAFDIQETAILSSKNLTKGFDNITYHHASHELITDLIDDYDGVIFNLGYLPQSDKKITTNYETTIKTLNKLHKNQKGFVLIVAYPGHIEGLKEAVAIQSFLDKLHIKYRVIRLDRITKKEAPFIFYFEN